MLPCLPAQVPKEVYTFIHGATFSCLTNVNFDDARFKVMTSAGAGTAAGQAQQPCSGHRTAAPLQAAPPPPALPSLTGCPASPCPCPQDYVSEAHRLIGELEAACAAAGVSGAPPAPDGLPQFDLLAHPARWRLDAGYLAGASMAQLVTLGQMTSLEHRRHKLEPTLLGLQELLTYGLRGLCAYTQARARARLPALRLSCASWHAPARCWRRPACSRRPSARPPTRPPLQHARMLGQISPEVDAFVAEAYAFLCTEAASDINNVRPAAAAWGSGGRMVGWRAGAHRGGARGRCPGPACPDPPPAPPPACPAPRPNRCWAWC